MDRMTRGSVTAGLLDPGATARIPGWRGPG